MKILHTSDWHLGHMLYNYDRTEEQQAMLNQMVKIVDEQKPDVFLLCGDVFHTTQPSAAVQTMLSEALVKIHDANKSMVIVTIAGNHDSSSKHDIFQSPWKALNVHTIGSLNKEQIDEHIVAVPGKGYIAAIPYTHTRNMPDGFFQQLLDRVAEMNQDNLPVVMAAHTTVKGCDFTGHDHATEITVGGIDAFEVDQMGQGYDYLALGHIHREQFVHTGKHNVRYSGTPIAVSFDENYPHSVSIVEIEKHGETPVVSKIEISNPRPLVTLPISGYTSWDEAKQQLAKYPDDIPAYIRLNVEIEDYLPADAHNQAVELTKGKQCRFCLINAKRRNQPNEDVRTLTIQEFQAEDPQSIAQQYAEQKGCVFDDEMKELLKEAIDLLNEESRN